ncbi:MAG: glycosyltransferase family 39 protein [Chloroflexota bacterium]|nr:glycosyltransferase family 39 protein [Chloroflexota bacterium]
MKWLHSGLLRRFIILVALAGILLAVDALCYQATFPLDVDVRNGTATLSADGTTTSLGATTALTTLQFVWYDPTIHEYQLDGSDSTNNYSLDTGYLSQEATSPYYLFQSWMRDLDGTSRWRAAQIWADGRLRTQSDWPANGASISLPPASTLHISVLLQRPETPRTLNLVAANGSILHITIDRNDRHIAVTRFEPGVGDNLPVASTFFPADAAPFAAEVIDTIARTLLAAVLVLLLVMMGEALVAVVRKRFWIGDVEYDESTGRGPAAPVHENGRAGGGLWGRGWHALTGALHPVALVMLGLSLLYVIWIAVVQYNGEPHIFDASAYLFAAKMYATGHLSVPMPPAAELFPGPFMIQFHGRWFAQYAPGTALTLAPGVLLGVPHLVEPILGTLALLGTGLIAARLYDRRVASLAVILGTLSPFYSYLAASYLSHAIALFYLVWGLWALLRFAQGAAWWHMPLAAVFFGMAGLTRDQVAVLFVTIILAGVLLLSWRQVYSEWRRWILPALAFVAVALLFVGLSLAFNAALTGSPWLSPRQLFFAGDHWGFGMGVGFYGQHTIAAGLVNLDELLTILAIDLFGWPFYLTLAFIAILFLTRKANGTDWLLLLWTLIMTGAYIGYFYHGIYLGPRYLFETLPFLLVLTARGILALGASALEVRQAVGNRLNMRRATGPLQLARSPAISVVTIALVACLLACNLLYFTPRQTAVYQNYTGLPLGMHVDLAAVYHPPMHHTIVVTDNYWLYAFVLFPLNDPQLHSDVIYASASNQAQYVELRQAFPGRTLYRIDVAPDGSVRYVALNGG